MEVGPAGGYWWCYRLGGGEEGPQRPSLLVTATIERIVALRAQGRSLRAIGEAVGALSSVSAAP